MNFRVQKYQNFQIQNVMLCVTINMIYVKKKEVQLLIQKKKLCLTHKKSWSTELTDYGKSLTKLMWNPLYRMTYRVGILLTPRATCMWSQTIAPAKLQPHI